MVRRLGNVMINDFIRNQVSRNKFCCSILLKQVLYSFSCITLLVNMSSGTANAADLQEASSSRVTKNEAIQAIPYAKLTSEGRMKAQSVINNISVFRKMPVSVFKCDSEFYLYCVNRPDSVVNMWEVLGISDVGLKQTGKNTYIADDGHGTKSKFEFLLRSYDKHLIYAEGSYMGTVFNKEVSGKALLLLRTGYLKQKTGETFIVHRLDVFVSLDSVGVDLLAKTFQPIVGKVADQNFVEVSKFVERLHKKVESDPTWSQQMSIMLSNVHPKTKAEFVEISNKLAVEYSLKQPRNSNANSTTSLKGKGRETTETPKAVEEQVRRTKIFRNRGSVQTITR